MSSAAQPELHLVAASSVPARAARGGQTFLEVTTRPHQDHILHGGDGGANVSTGRHRLRSGGRFVNDVTTDRVCAIDPITHEQINGPERTLE